MRRALRWLGTLLIVAGIGALVWSFAVWSWQDPFTYLLTEREQRALSSRYEERLAAFDPPAARSRPAAPARSLNSVRADLAAVASAYRRSSKEGDAIARMKVPRIGVDRVVVEGTETDTLKKGPGRYRGTSMPGEGELVYIAGHRTTYGAPFSHIDRLEPGDRVTVELPYATFEYAVTGRKIVPADFLQALDSRGREEVALQACWPRFFASQRIIVYAKPIKITLPGEQPFNIPAVDGSGPFRPSRSDG